MHIICSQQKEYEDRKRAKSHQVRLEVEKLWFGSESL